MSIQPVGTFDSGAFTTISSSALTLSTSFGSGNCVVVTGCLDHPTAVSSVTDIGGNTYTIQINTGNYVFIAFCLNPTNPVGTVTVTWTGAPGTAKAQLVARQFDGVLSSNALDGSQANLGTISSGNLPIAPAISPVANNELFVAVAALNGNTDSVVANSPLTDAHGTFSGILVWWQDGYAVQTGLAASYAPSFTITGSTPQSYSIGAISLKPGPELPLPAPNTSFVGLAS